jgi:hypothetical protein
MWNRIWIGLGGLAALALIGILLGVWLSWHAPVDPVVEETTPPAQVRPGDAPIAAADAQTFVPEPPQPRLDGSRGVPAQPVPAAPPVPMVSALSQHDPEVSLSTVAPDEDALRQQYQQGTPQSPTLVTSAPSQVTTVDAPSDGRGAEGRSPDGRGASPSAPVAQNDTQDAAWVQTLRADIGKCSSQGLVSRVICTEQARWRNCGPNNGWGKIPECPRTGNN